MPSVKPNVLFDSITKFVLLILALPIIGWIFKIYSLVSFYPDGPSMKMNTAILFISSTLSVILISKNHTKRMYHYVIFSLAIFSMLLSSATLYQYISGQSLGIDNLIINDPYQSNYPGRMSPATAICFLLFNFTLVISYCRHKLCDIMSQFFLTLIILLSLVSILSYLFEIPVIERATFIRSMSIPTSSIFMILCFCAFYVTPQYYLNELIFSKFYGSFIYRRLIIFLLTVPVVLALIIYYLESNGYFTHEFGNAAYTAAFIIFSILYSSFLAKQINDISSTRDRLLEALDKNNDRLALKNKLINEKSKDVEEFVYIVTHDFKEPLRSIKSCSALLKEVDNLDDELAKKSIGYIEQSADRLENQIQILLEYAKIGHNAKLVTINLNLLLDSIKSDLQAAIEEKKATIIIDNLPLVKAYEIEIRQLFQNLLSNAIKYAKQEEPPVIYISCTGTEHEWKFFVKDNGIGIDKRYIPKLFYIFNKAKSSESKTSHGIGLAHCKKIVEIHNGKIWVESTPGEGSTFIFTLNKEL